MLKCNIIVISTSPVACSQASYVDIFAHVTWHRFMVTLYYQCFRYYTGGMQEPFNKLTPVSRGGSSSAPTAGGGGAGLTFKGGGGEWGGGGGGRLS